jgi:hypothetical protein
MRFIFVAYCTMRQGYNGGNETHTQPTFSDIHGSERKKKKCKIVREGNGREKRGEEGDTPEKHKSGVVVQFRRVPWCCSSDVLATDDQHRLNADDIINKGKAISVQAWTGPEDSRRLRLPDLKTIGT